MKALIKYLVLLYLITLCHLLFAQKQYKLLVLNKKDLVLVEKTLPKQETYKSIQSIEKNLQNTLYSLYDNGYLTASFDSVIIDSTTYKTILHLGNKIEWAFLKIGNIEESYINQSGYREKLFHNKPFNYSQVSKLLNKLLSNYLENGYPFTSLNLDSIQLTENNISASLNVNHGQFYTFDSLNIVGSANVTKKYLYSLLSLKPNTAYNDKLFVEIEKKIKQCPFLTLTKAPEVSFYKKSATITLYIDNRKSSQVDGIIGFLPNSQNGELLITGDVKLKLLNAFKSGVFVDVNWRKLQAETQDLKSNVNYPFIFGSPFGVDGVLNIYKRDTSFLNVKQKLALQYLVSGSSYFQAFVENTSSNVLSNKLNNLYASTNYLGYGLGYKSSHLDYIFNPTNGYDLNVNTSIGQRNILKSGTSSGSTQVNWTSTINYYKPIFKNTSVLKSSLSAAQIINQQIFQNELYRIGGLKSLRGFNEEFIFASFYTIASVEYRFLMDENSFLALFFDQAYYQDKSLATPIYDTPYGFGAGINFETKTGVFSLYYALGSQQGNPIEFKNAKIHFGISSYF